MSYSPPLPSGFNFGSGFGLPVNDSYPLALPLPSSFANSLHVLRIDWGPQTPPGASNSVGPWGACASSSRGPLLSLPLSVASCGYAGTGGTGVVTAHSHSSITFTSLPGVGTGLNLSVTVVDAGRNASTSLPAAAANFSYSPPVITSFNANPTLVGQTGVRACGGAGRHEDLWVHPLFPPFLRRPLLLSTARTSAR